MVQQRLAHLRDALSERGWDAIVVSQPENRRYMSGFTGSAGLLVVAPQKALLLTDFRYVEQARLQSTPFEVLQISNGYGSQLAAVLTELRAATVAFEAAHVSVAEFEGWREKVSDVSWRPAESVVESLRTVKTAEEIEAVRRAIRLGDEALEHVLSRLCPGVSERQVAWDLESYMRNHGAEKIAFDLIVGSGPNGAMPHHQTGDRIIQAGEPIVIDMGAVVDGYHSDLTRTVCLGEPDERFIQIHTIVLRAQLAAETALHAGLTGQEADSVAREIIVQAGYGEQFQHSLGHGVGLAIHEGPRLSTVSTDTLQPGMIVTVEPGIYVPGWGGVRIEDMVLIRNDGSEVLTQIGKEWLLGDRART